MQDGQFHGDHAAHRIADHVGLFDLEMIQQADHVLGHFHAVGPFGFRLARVPVPAHVRGDDQVVFGKRFDNSRHCAN